MAVYRFVLAMVLALYVGFSRLNHLRFLEREPMLIGILKVPRLPPQCTFWRFLASLHLNVGGQILRLQQVMRQRVREAAHVELKTITLDTDTTVHTLFGHQMGGHKSYNPKNKGKKSYQRMSSEGWCIQWESTPPEQKSEFCSLGSREGRKLNPGSLSTKPSLGWGASHWAVTKVNAQVTPKLFTSEAEPPLVGRRLHGPSPTDRCGGTLWRGGSGST